MHILKATMNELDALTELFDLYRLFYKQQSDLSGAKVFLKERLSNEESVIFIAFDGQDAVGFAQLYPTFSSISMKKSWVLNDLYVKEEVRGRGYGQGLIRKAIAYVEKVGAKGILLETNDDNVIAQRLYEKIGFVKETNFFYYYVVK